MVLSVLKDFIFIFYSYSHIQKVNLLMVFWPTFFISLMLSGSSARRYQPVVSYLLSFVMSKNRSRAPTTN